MDAWREARIRPGRQQPIRLLLANNDPPIWTNRNAHWAVKKESSRSRNNISFLINFEKTITNQFEVRLSRYNEKERYVYSQKQ